VTCPNNLLNVELRLYLQCSTNSFLQCFSVVDVQVIRLDKLRAKEEWAVLSLFLVKNICHTFTCVVSQFSRLCDVKCKFVGEIVLVSVESAILSIVKFVQNTQSVFFTRNVVILHFEKRVIETFKPFFPRTVRPDVIQGHRFDLFILFY